MIRQIHLHRAQLHASKWLKAPAARPASRACPARRVPPTHCWQKSDRGEGSGTKNEDERDGLLPPRGRRRQRRLSQLRGVEYHGICLLLDQRLERL
uniref:Uncharacterized protein n=1 Tax=Arundo donax TaxID=35708 RepID=A0A0A9AIU3_ARUDO